MDPAPRSRHRIKPPRLSSVGTRAQRLRAILEPVRLLINPSAFQASTPD
jgi:hypothetical protein